MKEVLKQRQDLFAQPVIQLCCVSTKVQHARQDPVVMGLSVLKWCGLIPSHLEAGLLEFLSMFLKNHGGFCSLYQHSGFALSPGVGEVFRGTRLMRDYLLLWLQADLAQRAWKGAELQC